MKNIMEQKPVPRGVGGALGDSRQPYISSNSQGRLV